MTHSSEWVEGRRHPALEQVVAALMPTGVQPDWDVTTVAFEGDDGIFVARLLEGGSRIRISVPFFDPAHKKLLDDDLIVEWFDRQPAPATGHLALGDSFEDQESVTIWPRLRFERAVDDVDLAGIEDDVRAFADAWDDLSVASPPAAPDVDYGDPSVASPKSAWLFIGSENSYPDAADLAEARVDGEVGIFDTTWTAPRNSDVGDLALFYFIAPRKAACFVARTASRPFLETGIERLPDDDFDRNQWWTYVTALVEIEPIPYAVLREATDGNLILRGKGGRYLSARAISRLPFVAADPEDQSLVDRIVQIPSGPSELPAIIDMDVASWSLIPAGMLALESQVEVYVVDPLLAYVNHRRDGARVPLPPLVPARQYRLARRIVDYVVLCDATPLAAVEVKLSLRRPVGADWMTSPDFRQVRAYMDELGTPGMLVDSRSVWLIPRGGDAPSHTFDRATATETDLAAIVDLLFAQAYEILGGTRGILEIGQR